MTVLILLRHARVVVDPITPVADWPLAPDDGSLALLGRSLPWDEVARCRSSPEPKALGTATALVDVPVGVDDDLAEVDRGGWSDDYRADVARFFARPSEAAAPGWETADHAAARFDRAIRRHHDPAVRAPGATPTTVGCAGYRVRAIGDPSSRSDPAQPW